MIKLLETKNHRRWTLQSGFDRVCEWLTRPNAKQCMSSSTGDTVCMYRHYGNACAIGCLLPNDLPTNILKAKAGFYNLVAEHHEVYELFVNPDHDLWVRLQDLHDSYDWDNTNKIINLTMKERLSIIAKDFKLKQPKCIQSN